MGLPIKKKLIFLVGPTGIGKSAAALVLAKKINAEIVSCDSMQVYQKLDILASKPTPEQRKSIKHHMLDIIGPNKSFNVSSYRKKALSAAETIISRGKIPLFVGGTGLYYSVLIDGLFSRAPQDLSIRSKLYGQLEKKGSGFLHKKLAKIDRQAASRIHPNDSKRIIRAIEVYLKTGQPISLLQKKRSGLNKDYIFKIYALNMERKALYERINSRVEKMFKQGLIREVKSLLKERLSKTAACAIGIKEIRSYLEGKLSLGQAKLAIQKNSRNYAKRQLTWFRKDKRIKWVNVGKNDSAYTVAKKIWKKQSW